MRKRSSVPLAVGLALSGWGIVVGCGLAVRVDRFVHDRGLALGLWRRPPSGRVRVVAAAPVSPWNGAGGGKNSLLAGLCSLATSPEAANDVIVLAHALPVELPESELDELVDVLSGANAIIARSGGLRPGARPELVPDERRAPVLDRLPNDVTHAAVRLDSDLVLRRHALVAREGGRWVPSLATAAVMALEGYRPDQVVVEPGRLRLGGAGGIEIPLDPDGYAWLGAGPDEVPGVSMALFGYDDLIPDDVRADMGDAPGRVTFVGRGGECTVRMAGERDVPPVRAWARVAEALLSGDVLVPHGQLWGLVLLVVGALGLGLASARAPVGWALLAFGAALWVPLGLQWCALALGHYLPVASASLGLAVAGLGMAGARMVVTQRRMARTTDLLSRFVSPTLVRAMELPGAELERPYRAELSILFVDVAGFTRFVREGEPEEVSEVLSGFYALGLAALDHTGGSLNQFLGDGMLAYFGAPEPMDDAAGAAVLAAREVRERFEQLSQRRRERYGGAGLHLRCGIATGYVSVGYFGGKDRATYGVLGTAVNRAARIQQLAEPNAIVVDEATRQRLGERYRYRERAEQLKGLGELRLFDLLEE